MSSTEIDRGTPPAQVSRIHMDGRPSTSGAGIDTVRRSAHHPVARLDNRLPVYRRKGLQRERPARSPAGISSSGIGDSRRPLGSAGETRGRARPLPLQTRQRIFPFVAPLTVIRSQGRIRLRGRQQRRCQRARRLLVAVDPPASRRSQPRRFAAFSLSSRLRQNRADVAHSVPLLGASVRRWRPPPIGCPQAARGAHETHPVVAYVIDALGGEVNRVQHRPPQAARQNCRRRAAFWLCVLLANQPLDLFHFPRQRAAQILATRSVTRTCPQCARRCSLPGCRCPARW